MPGIIGNVSFWERSFSRTLFSFPAIQVLLCRPRAVGPPALTSPTASQPASPPVNRAPLGKPPSLSWAPMLLWWIWTPWYPSPHSQHHPSTLSWLQVRFRAEFALVRSLRAEWPKVENGHVNEPCSLEGGRSALCYLSSNWFHHEPMGSCVLGK